MAARNSVVIPPDDEVEPTPENRIIPGTSDTEALANSQKLGPSAKAPPVGMPKLVRIIVEVNDSMPPTGLPVSVNGRAYIIRAGEPVDVPENVLEVLDHAVMSEPIKDPQTLKVVGYRDRLRFPYRRLAARA